jgi:hypothetical protein
VNPSSTKWKIERINAINGKFNLQVRNAGGVRNTTGAARWLESHRMEYCKSIREVQERPMAAKSRLIRNALKRNYAACMIAAFSSRKRAIGTSHALLTDLDPRLVGALKALGTIGKPASNGTSKNKLGKCAEIKVAHGILSNDGKAHIQHLSFTRAVRPRTGEHMKRCSNCVGVFGAER